MWSNSITRQVTFSTTKIGWKCQNSNATFGVSFKSCTLKRNWIQDFVVDAKVAWFSAISLRFFKISVQQVLFLLIVTIKIFVSFSLRLFTSHIFWIFPPKFTDKKQLQLSLIHDNAQQRRLAAELIRIRVRRRKYNFSLLFLNNLQEFEYFFYIQSTYIIGSVFFKNRSVKTCKENSVICEIKKKKNRW